MSLDIEKIRNDFPILHQEVHGKPLVYLDNAATSQKPQAMIDAIVDYYQHDNANVHRGVHTLSERATKLYETARDKVRQFIHAEHTREIIFTKGATESINLVANCFARSQLQTGDEIIVSQMEHHSNIVPWQLACEQTGAKLRVLPINQAGELELDKLSDLINDKTKLIAIVHISNALGTINPVKEIIAQAHQRDIPVLVDATQSLPRMTVDVRELDCDFMVFSGHKMYGPAGIGVLYGKQSWLDKLPPYQGGGEMITEVHFDKTRYAPLPAKFEAGTPNIVGAIGLGASIDYLNQLGMDNVLAHETELLEYTAQALHEIQGLRFIGEAKQRTGLVTFVFDDIHAHDVGTILDHQGIAVRAGHHCAMPTMEYYQVPATIRASFGIYTTKAEIDSLTEGLCEVRRMFS